MISAPSTANLRTQLTAKLGREPRLSDVADAMGERLTAAAGGLVAVTLGFDDVIFIQAVSSSARAEAIEVLKLAGRRLDRVRDLPPDADEPEFTAGLFCAWVV